MTDWATTGRARSESPPATAGGIADPLTLAETLLAVAGMLHGVASGHPLDRTAASHYTDWRLRLLQSELQPLLPGFLYQCVSLLRFKDFITLYDPDIAHRQRFVGRAFAAARGALGLDDAAAAADVEPAPPSPVAPPPATEALRSAHWMR